MIIYKCIVWKFCVFFSLVCLETPPLTEDDGRPEGIHTIGTGTNCKQGTVREFLNRHSIAAALH